MVNGSDCQSASSKGGCRCARKARGHQCRYPPGDDVALAGLVRHRQHLDLEIQVVEPGCEVVDDPRVLWSIAGSMQLTEGSPTSVFSMSSVLGNGMAHLRATEGRSTLGPTGHVQSDQAILGLIRNARQERRRCCEKTCRTKRAYAKDPFPGQRSSVDGNAGPLRSAPSRLSGCPGCGHRVESVPSGLPCVRGGPARSMRVSLCKKNFLRHFASFEFDGTSLCHAREDPNRTLH